MNKLFDFNFDGKTSLWEETLGHKMLIDDAKEADADLLDEEEEEDLNEDLDEDDEDEDDEDEDEDL